MKTKLTAALRLLALTVVLALSQSQAQAQCEPVWLQDPQFRLYLRNNYPQVLNAQDSLLPCEAALVTGCMDFFRSPYTVGEMSNFQGLEFFTGLSRLNIGWGHSLQFMPDLSYSTNIDTVELYGMTLPSNYDQNFLPYNISVLYINECNFPTFRFPVLPPALVEFYSHNSHCYFSLLIFPSGIEIVDIYDLDVLAIPSFPSSLREFRCDRCLYLDTIPLLPNELRKLSIPYGNLRHISNFPDSLKYIAINQQRLTSTPPLPDGLETFYCYENLLTEIPTLPNSLIVLHCSKNNLSVLPDLPASLVWLNCEDNNLGSLPTLPPNLQHLEAGYNGLSYLPALPRTITHLEVENNQLRLIEPLAPFIMSTLNLRSNQFAYVPSFPRGLTDLFVDSNQIQCLPALPNSTRQFGCAGNPFACLPNIPTNTNFYTNCGTTVCAAQCTTPLNYIGGTVFMDMNGNNVKDIDDLPYKGSILSVHGLHTSSDPSGQYGFQLPSGSYTLTATPPKWFSTIPSNPIAVNLPGTTTVFTGYNYLLTGTPNITDVTASLAAVRQPQAGFSYCYRVGVRNEGTVAASGTLDFAPDAAIGYTGQTQFSFSNLGVGQRWDTTVCAVLPTTLAVGTALSSSAVALPTLPDADTTTNRAVEPSVVVGSYDPNDKAVSPDGYLTPADVADRQPLTYTVRFQNTGNAPAYIVYIDDTLDFNALDVSTLKVLSASHPYELSLNGQGNVRFSFPGIVLPDSTNNEPASHGFVRYRILPKTTLQIGDSIVNTAHIYFDFNPAVITNTTRTDILPPPTVALNPLGQSAFCAGSSFYLHYNASGTFDAGNGFTAQLSDASGSFAAPQVLANQAAGAGADSLLITLPATTGSGFRIRVAFTSREGGFSDTLAAFSIQPIDTPRLAISGLAQTSFCAGTSQMLNGQLTGATGGTYQWQVSTDGGQNFATAPNSIPASQYDLANLPAGTYLIRLKASGLQGACLSADSAQATTASIEVLAVPAAPVLTLGNVPTTPLPGLVSHVVTTSLTTGTPSGYDWQVSTNGGAFAAAPNATTADTYDVAFLGQGTHRVLVIANGLSINCLPSVTSVSDTSDTFVINAPSSVSGIASTFVLSPNPTTGSVTLSAPELAGQALSISILDATGREVHRQQADFTGSLTLDLSELAVGLYALRIQTQSGAMSQKLLITR